MCGRRLLFGAARENQPHCLLVHGFDEAAAVKACLSRVAAASVGHTHEAQGSEHQFGGLISGSLSNLVDPCQQALLNKQALHLINGCDWSSHKLRGEQEDGDKMEQTHRLSISCRVSLCLINKLP